MSTQGLSAAVLNKSLDIHQHFAMLQKNITKTQMLHRFFATLQVLTL